MSQPTYQELADLNVTLQHKLNEALMQRNSACDAIVILEGEVDSLFGQIEDLMESL